MRATPFHKGQHCRDEELTAELGACPLCGFSGERASVLTVQRHPAVVLLECPQCHGASASRMPKPEVLERYYAGYYDQGDTPVEKVTFSRPDRFARHIHRLCSPTPSSSEIRVLDFGGGDGSLSLALADRLVRSGADRVSIDLVDYAEPAQAVRPGVTVRHARSVSDVGAGGHHIVLASAIVEHLPDPSPELLKLFSLMAPGGFFYARTPWMVPLLRIVERLGRPFDFTFPAHVHDMGRRYWEGVPRHLTVDSSRYTLVHSGPSVVETGLSDAPLRTVAAHVLKAPARVWRGWPFVGGWEVVYRLTRT